ncbi:unnamed protein product [Moneuplotes crassus]|uniref:Tetraspanin family protein n=1 Tax=Euplotes crassus TaxID=5936 RepID=A0AAD1XXC5_EUPCR|nr:unnamed protein product [Moneuplotes crassus]
MCYFPPKCVKVALFFVSLFLIACGAVSIWFGVTAKDFTIYGIIGSLAGFDLQQILFLVFVILGCFLFFVCVCGACISLKRVCLVHCCFTLMVTLSFIVFLVTGIGLIVGTELIVKEMDKACEDPNAGGISESFRELYASADTIYCINGITGCECYVNSTRLVGPGYTMVNSSSTVIRVQQCTAHLEEAYADYGVSFDDLNAIMEYLTYFGDIEREYKCSGICTFKNKYYFSDINIGAPEKTCFDVIRDDIILGDVRNYGIGYTVSGAVLFIIWFVQYGLCCRKKKNARKGQTKMF